MNTHNNQSSGGFFVTLIALAFVVTLGAGITAYAMGWMTVDSEPEKTTIEVNTGEVNEALDAAGEEGQQLLEETGEALKETGTKIQDAVEGDNPDGASPETVEEESQ